MEKGEWRSLLERVTKLQRSKQVKSLSNGASSYKVKNCALYNSHKLDY